MILLEAEIKKAGGGVKGFLTSALNTVVKGLALDPVPFDKHTEIVKAEYDDAIVSAVKNVMAEKIDTIQFVNSMQGEVERGVARAYVMGMRTVSPRAAIGDEDYDRIQEISAKQMSFIRNFANDMATGAGTMDYVDRAELYADALDGAFNAGAMSRLSDEVVIYWEMGKAEHCGDCVDMSNGSPYSPDELKIFPRSGDTACHNRCKCELKITTRPKDFIRGAIRKITGI